MIRLFVCRNSSCTTFTSSLFWANSVVYRAHNHLLISSVAPASEFLDDLRGSKG